MLELNQSAIAETLQTRFPEWQWVPKMSSDIMGFSRDYANCCDLYVSATHDINLGFISSCRTEGASKSLRRKFSTGRAPTAAAAITEAVQKLLKELGVGNGP